MRQIKKIIIVNTTWYCGGSLVLSALCRELTKLGYDARLFLFRDFPRTEEETGSFSKIIYSLKQIKHLIGTLVKKKIVRTHLKGCKIQLFPFFSKDTIILYPEDLFGNPLKAQNVARWFLFHYRYTDVPNAYSPSDCFFSFREIFNDYKLNPTGQCVCLNSFDSDLYRQYNHDTRTGNCYILRKGKDRKDLPKEFDGPIIDTLSEEEKVQILNEKEFCISYDTQTFYSSIAAVCGCKSIVIPEPGKTKKDYFGPDDVEPFGVAYGTDENEIQYALSTRDKLIQSLDFSEKNQTATKKFIEIISNHFIK